MNEISDELAPARLLRTLVGSFRVLSCAFAATCAVASAAEAETTGYKVFGQAGIAIAMDDNPRGGRHDTTFSVISGEAGDCLKLGGSVEAMQRICEKMGKEGKTRLIFSGKLRRVADQTLEGSMVLPGDGFTFDLRLMTSGNKVAIALMSINGGPMRALLTTGEPAMYERLADSRPPAILPFKTWRLPQEKLPDIGFDLEAELTPAGLGYQGRLVLWFRAETDEISGFCPDTHALRRICERIYKDGPLQMLVNLDQAAPNRTAGWRGTVSSPAWEAGSFEVDLYRGAAIPDWGDEEPQAFYLRFRSPGVAPGGEAVAWLKLEPLGREIVTPEELAQRGTFDRPAASPPQPPASAHNLEADPCDDLRARMSALPDRAAREAASQAIAEAGFWGGILPSDADGCRSAAGAIAAVDHSPGGEGSAAEPGLSGHAKSAAPVGRRRWNSLSVRRRA